MESKRRVAAAKEQPFRILFRVMGMMRKKADTALTKSGYDVCRLRTTRQIYSQCNRQINKQLLRQAKETVNQSPSNEKIVVSLHS